MRRAIGAPLLALLLAAPLLGQGEAPCVGGQPSAPVRIEVFSDYQCPACAVFYLDTMRAVLREYADQNKACVVYREFPLSMHTQARPAARFGHAAMQLGKRQWATVTDALYQAQEQWALDGNVEAVVAGALNPEDMQRVRQMLAQPAIDAAIDADIALARRLGVNQTPTFFITANGKTEKAAGVVQYPVLRRYLDHLLGQ